MIDDDDHQQHAMFPLLYAIHVTMKESFENLGLKIPNSIYMYKNQLYNIRMFPSLVNLEDNIMYRNV